MKDTETVLEVLEKTLRNIEQDNVYEIRGLSNKMIESAAVSQDPDNIIIAVLIYSLGKVLERDNYRNIPGWDEFYQSTIKNLKSGIRCLKNEKAESCRNFMGRIRSNINKIEGSLSGYIREVFRKAEINKAFKLYEHGLSSEQTAQMLGVSLWDLASFIGQSNISEARASITMPIKQRIKLAEEFFK
jgi:hypothetical protein